MRQFVFLALTDQPADIVATSFFFLSADLFVFCYLATYSNFFKCMAIGKTSHNRIPLKPIGNTDNKIVNPQTEQHSHAHAALSVDCNYNLLPIGFSGIPTLSSVT